MGNTTSRQQLLTEQEAAQHLSLAVKTLQRWRWAGKGPQFVKIGAAVRYEVADLDAFIAAGRRRSTSDTGRGRDHAPTY